MNKFEDFIDFLTLKGVKSIHIELQTPERLSRTLETHIGTIGESDTTVVERGAALPPTVKVPTAAEVVLPQIAKEISDKLAIKKAADKKAADDKAEDDRNAAELARVGAAEEAAIAEEEAAAKKAEQVKLPKAKKEKAAKSETKPEASGADLPIWEQLAQAKDAAARQKIFSAQPKTAYEVFDDMVTADDGTITAEHRKAVIDCMNRAELLMVNNTFRLGLDTDVPEDNEERVNEFRAIVAGCF